MKKVLRYIERSDFSQLKYELFNHILSYIGG